MGQQFSLGDPPEKNIKDGLYTLIGGAVVIAIDYGLEEMGEYWDVYGMSLTVLGGIIAGIGAVMTAIGVVRKLKGSSSSGDDA